jgi:hypothetical protein
MPARAFATLVPIMLLETSFGNTAGSRPLGLVRAEIGFRMDFPTTLSVDLFCHSLSRGYAITQNFVSLSQMKQRATKNPRQVPSRGRRFLPCGRQKMEPRHAVCCELCSAATNTPRWAEFHFAQCPKGGSKERACLDFGLGRAKVCSRTILTWRHGAFPALAR